MRPLTHPLCLIALLLAMLCASALAETAEPVLVPETLLSVEVLEGVPDFSGRSAEAPFIEYGALDALGRATGATALLDRDMLTLAPRLDLSQINLPGMHNARYDFIEDGWVYNRCHLIGHRFSGSSEPDNLITGTHALNFSYMLPYEDQIAEFLRATGERVFCRMTPLYEGDERVCRALLMEALSCDEARTLCFRVLCPNAQPGVAIDYLTGYTALADDWQSGGTDAGERDYIINRHTGKFHTPQCPVAADISPRNREERRCRRTELFAEGLLPCGQCCP